MKTVVLGASGFIGRHLCAALAARGDEVVEASLRDVDAARVDLVRGGDGAPLLLELELAEPSLFLGLGSGAAARLAEAIARRLRQG